MATDTVLPFALNCESLAQWLDSLRELSHPQAAHRLSQLFKQLKANDFNADELLPLLYNLTPLTLHFSTSLSSTTSALDLSDKTLKLSKMSIQLPRQLALIFCRLLENKQLQPTQQPTCIFYALQLIGYCLRYYALNYEIPSTTLWKKSAELYKLAAISSSLTLQQTTKLSEFKAQGSIASVIKRNILFHILLPTVYKSDEINPIFQLANHYADLVNMTPADEANEFGFYWDLENDTPPQPIKKNNRNLPGNSLTIDTCHISQELQLGALVTKLSPATQGKLALHLDSYRQLFDSIIPGLPSRTTLILGFASICYYLQELSKLAKISQLSAQSRDSSDIDRTLSLMPMEHQRNVFDKVDTAFSQSREMGQAVNILKTPNKSYCVAERRTLDCKTGDIVLLYKEQHPVTLGIIRQQKFNDLSNAQQVLLELIPGNCSIYVLADREMDTFAIVTGANSDKAQVFMDSERRSLHTPISVTTGQSFTLTACLESSPFFTRYKFV